MRGRPTAANTVTSQSLFEAVTPKGAGVGVGVLVGVGVNVGVFVGVGDGVCVGVLVDVAVAVGVTEGPNICPGPQALSTKVRSKLALTNLPCAFMSNLPSRMFEPARYVVIIAPAPARRLKQVK